MKDPKARAVGELAWKLFAKASRMKLEDQHRSATFRLAEELVFIAYDMEDQTVERAANVSMR